MLKALRMLMRVVVAILLLQGVASECFFKEQNSSEPTTTLSTDRSEATEFGITLFKELLPQEEEKNFFFSPYSIWNALTIAYFGSKGETERQIRKILGVSNKFETLERLRSLEYMYQLEEEKANYTFRLANRAYFDEKINLNPCIEKILSNELHVVDMSMAYEVSTEINDWVSNTTNGRIIELVKEEDMETDMIIANAAYFQGSWLHQFNKNNTVEDIFYSFKGKHHVDMMVQKGNFRHGISSELGGAHILVMPYSGDSISMIILLPRFHTDDTFFNAMVDKLNADSLEYALENLFTSVVEITLPKFTLDQFIGSELITALANMGITDMFDMARANFKDFSSYPGLSFGKTIHKAFVEVSEEGTEAAAATAFISYRTARPLGPTRFNCNRPFVFMIYDKIASNALFIGAFKQPKK